MEASNIRNTVDAALQALQNLRREDVIEGRRGEEQPTSTSMSAELRRAFPTLQRPANNLAAEARVFVPYSTSRRRPVRSSSSASTATKSKDKIVHKDLILIPDPDADKVPMHGKRIELATNGYVIHEFPFQKSWNERTMRDKIIQASKARICLRSNT
eukprot:gene831-123_t